MSGQYVHDALLGLQLLGGVLATPSLEASDENQQTEQQKLLALAQGKPAPTSSVDPGWFSANRPGVYGSILSGVGGLGQLMSTLGGRPVKAPRYNNLPAELEATKLGEKTQEDAAATGLFTDPQAAGLYKAGFRAAAVKKQFGVGNEQAPNLWRTIQTINDPKADPAEKAAAQANFDLYVKAQGGAAGARAAAVDPIQAGAEARRTGLAQGSKATQDAQGHNLVWPHLGRGADGSFGVQRNTPPALLDGIATGAVQTIADFAPRPNPDAPPAGAPDAPPGMVRSGAREEAGSGSVEYARPDKASSDVDLLASQLGIDLRNPTPQQSQDLLLAQRQLDFQRKRGELLASTDPTIMGRQAMKPAMDEAAKKLVETTQIRAQLDQLEPLVTNYLTRSVAGSLVQPMRIAFDAKNGDMGAKAVQLLIPLRTRLARTVDVGNLSEQEQTTWDPYVNATHMTAQEFGNSMQILRSILQRNEAVQRTLLKGQLPEGAGDTGAPPPASAPAPAAAGGGSALDDFLTAHGH